MNKIYCIILLLLLIFINTMFGEDENEKIKSWNFELLFGLNLHKGNTDKTGGHSSFDIKRFSSIDELILKWNIYYSETSEKKDTHKGDFTVKYDYDFLKKETLFLFVIPSYNEFQDIKIRVQNGLGLKHTFYKNQSLDYSLSCAVLYEIKYFISDDKNEELIRLSFRPKFKYLFNKSSKLMMILFYQPKVNLIKDYRILSEFILEFNISGNLFFEFKIIDEYNNIVPIDIKRNDFSIINGLKIKF